MRTVHPSLVVHDGSTRSVMDQKGLVEALLLKSMTQLKRGIIEILLAGEQFDSLGIFLHYPVQRCFF